ncbi:MAG: L-threonylcarbamoyladenylate synthase [Chitinophagaceae bacterium]|nr:threonylcarbamoyl-AMP synthase [Chitinophagaceae bacterium]HQU56362.1 L-threonylcarbamoyladenylate synthase [Chitinophagaceae bacterium]HQV05424.1 L-threonylcarbamoyladenylate synthase [Chitinophagaceae bacterium]
MLSFENDIQAALKVLEAGGIILYPTDTVWGIGADATNPAAVEKIYQLKQRPGQKAMIVLLANEKDLLRHIAALDLQVFDYLQTTQKPTTVIYEGALGFADNLTAPDGSIAIRICKEEFCRHLLQRFKKPLVSTSANIAGEPTAKNFREIAQTIRQGVDYIVNYRQDDIREYAPSAIVKWKNGAIEVIRS